MAYIILVQFYIKLSVLSVRILMYRPGLSLDYMSLHRLPKQTFYSPYRLFMQANYSSLRQVYSYIHQDRKKSLI